MLHPKVQEASCWCGQAFLSHQVYSRKCSGRGNFLKLIGKKWDLNTLIRRNVVISWTREEIVVFTVAEKQVKDKGFKSILSKSKIALSLGNCDTRENSIKSLITRLLCCRREPQACGPLDCARLTSASRIQVCGSLPNSWVHSNCPGSHYAVWKSKEYSNKSKRLELRFRLELKSWLVSPCALEQLTTIFFQPWFPYL
jgi:hypothetical protein